VITPTPFDDSAFARDLPGTEPWSPGGGSEGIDGDGSGVSDDGTGTGSMPEALPDTSVYPFVERQPIPVKVVNPDYPSEARRLALDGSVTVRVLVERDGRVSKASIVQSTNDMFNECAEGAALKWIFVPGMMTNGPVRVWVAIPFRFALAR
jgi:protein TonB